MITVENLEIHLGDRPLFNSISFQVNPKDRIGLVGRNGAGKSTLLKVISGEISEFKGSVQAPTDYKIAYLAQTIVVNDNNTVEEEVRQAFNEREAVEKRIGALNQELETRTDYETDGYMRLCEELGDLNERLALLDSDNLEAELEKVLLGLGFERKDFGRKLGEFSGGWKMRAELARLLLSSPDMLLLDEPTNHLDIVAVQWLENYLKDSLFPIILISHDREFLDAITNRTIEINAGKIFDYKYHYSKYLIEREQDLEKQLATKANQEKERERMEKLIAKFRAKANKAAFAQSLMKKLDNMETIDIDHFDDTSLNVRFQKPAHSGKVIMDIQNLEKSYDDLTIFNQASCQIIRGQKLGLLGKNGIGKSTLIRLILGEKYQGGLIEHGHQVKIGYFDQLAAEKLDGNRTVLQEMEDGCPDEMFPRVRGLLGAFMFSGEDVDKKVKVLSGGEKTRLVLCKLMLEPYNFLILDEPTNHLDIASKEILRQALLDYQGTLLLVSHDRAFMRDMFSDILIIEDKKINNFIGGLDEFLAKNNTDSVKLYESEALLKKKNQPKKAKKETPSKPETPAPIDKAKAKEIKQIERELKELELKKDKLENEIANVDPAKDESVALFKEYAKVKEEMESCEERWLELND